MIVDLLRNDLSRISVVGSVAVPALFSVETFPTLHTLTSTVTADRLPGTSLRDTLAAVFPCGSITGAPKLRAMEIIRELEPEARGVYTGAIGVFSPGGACRLNVAIRTATLSDDGRGRYGVGGGVVVDSSPEGEYQECLLKARVLTDLAVEYGLIETLRWSRADGFVRIDLHLDRLCRSAGQLGFSFDRADIQQRLAEHIETYVPAGDDRRIRIELRRDGHIAITSAALLAEPERPLLVGIATTRVDRGDPFLRHKTTRRQIYETAFATAQAKGQDEVIFLNREGLVTEASRSNIFVEQDGGLITPPLAAGLLPGILRQALLEGGKAVERNVTVEDLRHAQRWFLGNSLRGLREARIVSHA